MKSDKGSATYIFALTLVATLGGLLFGYDTAVISGATGALKNFFIAPLYTNPVLSAQVIVEYKFIVSLCLVIVAVLLGSFLVKLFGKQKGGIYMAILAVIALLVWYFRFWAQPNELTEGMANAINGFTISSALVGCIIGGSLGGYISQTLGRRNGMMKW